MSKPDFRIGTEEELKDRLAPVVLGGDILGYSYVRAFHERYGLKTIILSQVEVKSTAASRFCDYRIVENMGDEAVLLSYLDTLADELERQGRVGLLLGSVDWHVRFFAHNKEKLSERFILIVNDEELIDRVTRKESFYALMEELGIPYPETWVLNCGPDGDEIDPADFPYPLIGKPSDSSAYDLIEFEGKKKIYEIADAAEMAEVLAALRASGYERPFIFQDCIPGPDDHLRSLTTFSDAKGEMKVVSGGRVVLQDHDPMRLGNPVCIMSEELDEIIEGARRFLAHTGYRGYANFDIKYDPRDDSYKFFEVNARLGRNTFYVSLGGVNFVEPIVDEFVLGREREEIRAYDPFVYELIPPMVVKRHVEDTSLRNKVLAMYRAGFAHSPEDYAPDTLAHKLWSKARRLNMIRKFKRYMPR